MLAAMRPQTTDALVAAVLLCGVLAAAVSSTDPFPWASVLMVVPLAWRRGCPTLACAGCGAGLLATTFQPTARPLLVIVVLAIVIAASSAALHGRVPWLGPALLAAALAPSAGRLERLPFTTGEVPFLVVVAAAFAGFALRTHARHAVVAQAAALSADRARIARELHDVVTHRVTLMVVAAGAARMLLPEPEGRAADQLRVIESGGREALRELRGLLGLLAPDHDDQAEDVPGSAHGDALSPRSPQPGIADLPDLVSSMRSAGLPVRFTIDGTQRPLPTGIDLTAYRIVQEALTNSLRHSTRAGTTVAMEFEPTGLTIRVADDRPAPGAQHSVPGRGLFGMRERVGVYGGTLTTGAEPGRGYAVTARLPLPPEAP
jgi:signal transduction histidine kinase